MVPETTQRADRKVRKSSQLAILADSMDRNWSLIQSHDVDLYRRHFKRSTCKGNRHADLQRHDTPIVRHSGKFIDPWYHRGNGIRPVIADHTVSNKFLPHATGHRGRTRKSRDSNIHTCMHVVGVSSSPYKFSSVSKSP